MGWFCPKCPPCGDVATVDCECCRDIPEDLTIDATGGTLTDDTDATGCQGCNELNAVFTLVPVAGCAWEYEGQCDVREAWEDDGCSFIANPQFNWGWSLAIAETNPGVSGVCRWQLTIAASFSDNNTCDTEDASYAVKFPIGLWHSATFTKDGTSLCTFPVTLTKVSTDDHNSCGGSLPTTITLDVA